MMEKIQIKVMWGSFDADRKTWHPNNNLNITALEQLNSNLKTDKDYQMQFTEIWSE